MVDLLERLQVSFSKPLDRQDVESLFHDIKINVRCTIAYQIILNCLQAQKQSPQRYTSRISGNMSKTFDDIGLGLAEFNCSKEPLSEELTADRERPDLFYGIQFIPMPGYKYEELPKAQRKLIEEVQEFTSTYFSRFSCRNSHT